MCLAPAAQRFALAALVAFAWLAVAAATPAQAKAELPKLDGFVIDPAGALHAGRAGLDRELATFRDQTKYAIVVFLPRTLDDESIEDLAYRAFNTWKLGEAGKDTGILLVVATAEHKIRIETGKGAGGAVTDLQSSDIIGRMAPLMKQGQVSAAVSLAVTELQSLVRKEVGAPAPPADKPTRLSKRSASVLHYVILAIIGLVVLLAILGMVRKKRRTTARGLTSDPRPARSAISVFDAVGTILKIVSSVAGAKGGGKSRRRGPGGGGSSGGGGASGGY